MPVGCVDLSEGTTRMSVAGWMRLCVGVCEPSGCISASVNSTVVLGIPSQPCSFLIGQSFWGEGSGGHKDLWDVSCGGKRAVREKRASSLADLIS